MKRIPSDMLLKGNLTPRERYILLIQNDVHRMKTGKEILTPADKDALENWKAQNNQEAKEWNEMNDGWKHTGKMNIEAEFLYKDAQVNHFAQLPIILTLLYYPSHRQMGGCIETLKKLKKVSVEEAVEIATKQKEVKLKEGMDFDYAIYQLAFERMSEEDRKHMKDLYCDIGTDHQYLDQEEIIANLYNGKSELDQKGKHKLSELLAEWSYNKFAKEYQLFHYFACIPIVEVAKHFLKSKGVEIPGKPMSKNQESDDEDSNTHEKVTEAMKAYAEKHKTDIKDMLKEGCLLWLDQGLLDEYTPLIRSNQSDLLKRWLSTKVETRKILNKHIDAGELILRKRTEHEARKNKLYSKGLYDVELAVSRQVLEDIGLEVTQKGEIDEKVDFETFGDVIITGESLHAFKGEYDFVKDFKERVEKYDPNLGIVYADSDPEHTGEHLDQELVICDKTDKGEPSFFSLYGMATAFLSSIYDSKTFFTEAKEDGKIFIKFKDAKLEEAFLERNILIVSNYAKLLAFESLFKKVGKIYDADLAFYVTERLRTLRGYIEQNNESIRVATNTSERAKKDGGLFRQKEILYFKEDLIIDIDSIKPDEKEVEEHKEKLKEIFGEF